MANKKKLMVPFQKQTSVLATALAEKGTPGIILLGIMIFIVWIVPVIFTFGTFSILRKFKAFADENSWIFIALLLFCFIVLFFLIWFSYSLTKHILGLIVPTIRVEAEAATLMPQAFGGRVSTVTGGLAVLPLLPETTGRRIRKILEVLVHCATAVLHHSNSRLVRANIFITTDNQWLSIANDFHVNIKGTTPSDRELTIRILNGYWSSGTAYKYFHSVLSISHEDQKGNIVWDHAPDRDTVLSQGIDTSVLQKAYDEIKKAHADLRWIISMPIPYQVSPFKMACGVLNIDGLGSTPFRDQLMSLLVDAATAAALVGVMNRTTDILGGQCHRPDKVPVKVGGIKHSRLRERFMIEPDEFDPAVCPELSKEFKDALSEIKGLEFMRRITTTDVAEFLREQLRA
ncbi:hypothetical protein ES705_20645 [subsurface metagenome]